MENSNIFQNTDVVDGELWHCSRHNTATEVKLCPKYAYPILFVLEGEVTLSHHVFSVRVPHGHFIVIQQTNIEKCLCSTGTVLLEFCSSESLGSYMGKCASIFQRAWSPIIPILPPLKAWIDELLASTAIMNQTSPQSHDNQQQAMVQVMMEYPREVLDELYVALLAQQIAYQRTAHQHL